MILSVDKRRISLSLKPSHFVEEDFEGAEGQPNAEDPGSSTFGVVDEDDETPEGNDPDEEMNPSSDNEDGEDDDEMVVDVDTSAHIYRTAPVPRESTSGPSTSLTPTPTLKLSGGFHWSGINTQPGEDFASDSSSNESEGEGQASKKKRRRKEIEQDLTADMHTKTPESNADFERLLLGSPNSSYLWIQYMSFQLQLSEINKAREIARRALRTINFREEQEKLNVWIALLNLENVYGTDETLETAFKEAARANDSKTIHLRLALVFDQTDKHEVRVLPLALSTLRPTMFIESRRTVQAYVQEVWSKL